MGLVETSAILGFGGTAQGRLGASLPASASWTKCLVDIASATETAFRRISEVCELRAAASRERGADTLVHAASSFSASSVTPA